MWPPATVADGCGSPIDLVSYCLSLYKWCLVIKSWGISGNTRCSFLGNWIASFPFLENFFLAYGKTMKRHYFLWPKRRKKNGWNDCDFSFQLRKQIHWLQTVFTFFCKWLRCVPWQQSVSLMETSMKSVISWFVFTYQVCCVRQILTK